MKKINDHEALTRERYKDISYTKQYKSDYISFYNFKGFKSRIIAYREIKSIDSFLKEIIRNNFNIINLLDIPCGTEKLESTLSNYSIKITAADISDSMIELVKSEYSLNKTNFEIVDATNILHDKNSFDVIVCLRLFQRLAKETRKKILCEFNRVGSKYLIISYSFNSFWQSVRYKIKRVLNNNTPKFFSNKMNNIMIKLNDSGFDIIKSRSILSFFSSEIIFLTKYKKK